MLGNQTQLGDFLNGRSPKSRPYARPAAQRFHTLSHDGAEPCKRCGGKGNMPHFAHIDSGICFWCNGSGKQ